jgi:hypothetical protein
MVYLSNILRSAPILSVKRGILLGRAVQVEGDHPPGQRKGSKLRASAVHPDVGRTLGPGGLRLTATFRYSLFSFRIKPRLAKETIASPIPGLSNPKSRSTRSGV